MVMVISMVSNVKTIATSMTRRVATVIAISAMPMVVDDGNPDDA